MFAQQRNTVGEEAGFAATDAVVALVILASTLALSLRAMETARAAAAAAEETRQATQTLRDLISTSRRQPGSLGGQSTVFAWRMEVTQRPVGPSPTAPRLCYRSASATSLKSGRRFQLSTVQVCPPSGSS